MAKVTNLSIQLQTGSNGTYFASWDFNEETKSSSSSSIKVGSLVTIKSGATYYNGVAIPSWVMADKWYISQVSGDRAVLGKNPSGTHNIVSPINTKYLEVDGGTTTEVAANTLDHYTVKWYYDTGNSVWFTGGSSDVKEKNATYNPPENAIKIRVSVTPVSKTRQVNNQTTSHWTGTAVTKDFSLIDYDPPDTPDKPNVDIEKYTLTASINDIKDEKIDEIAFEVYNGTTRVRTGTATVLLCRASFTCNVSAGGKYSVRCRAVNINSTSKVYSEWSGYSDPVESIPAAPAKITSCKATSETSVYIEWEAVDTAKTYELEYTTEKRYFDGSDSTTKVSSIEFNHYEKTGLESGDEYFFRVRALNSRDDSSAWSPITSVVVGKKPAAPTTWSSTTTAITGEALTLYWVHNSQDGSSQTFAELELDINGIKETYTIKNSTEEDEKDKTSSYPITTTSYVEGTQIQWRVRTAGITNSYGDWSIQRTIDIYAPPTLELKVTDDKANSLETITTFPFYISALGGPNTQMPIIGYHLSITSDSTYETVDNVGNLKLVNAGEAVYSKYFDTNGELVVEFSAGNINLENGVSYTATCTVTMSSGLTAESSLGFNVSWEDDELEPDAEIAVDTDTFVAYVRPYCKDADDNFIEDISLAVYRREFDGSYTELASGIDNNMITVVTDPHPALDYARYRIVATTNSTGAVSYYDPPGYPVGGKAVIIQWDEEWSSFDGVREDAMEEPTYSGSILKLPYNVDVSDNNKSDVQLIEYIGRSHPVSYYGTQLGQSATWNVEIERDDEETLYGLRRLSRWMGDVYVREPSGSGYWANIKVSFNQKHCAVTIPVTLELARVEGGV